MICKKCGAEAVDGAIFCGSCGARLDEKKECIFCGKLNDERTAYCVYCGKRIDGKNVCSACGVAYEGNFCPSCGQARTSVRKSFSQEEKPYQVREKNNGNEGFEKVGKVFNIAGSGLAMLGVLCALIFVFFIGLTASPEGFLSYLPNNLFYYFGKYYKEIGAIDYTAYTETGVSQWFQDLLQRGNNTVGVFGTVISAAALLSVVTCAIGAIVIYVRQWLGLTQKRADGWALACIFSFLISAALFAFLHNVKVSIYQEGVVEVSLNGATKAGIVLCIVFTALFAFCRILELGKKLKSGKILGVILLGAVSFAFVLTAFLALNNACAILQVSSPYIGNYTFTEMDVDFLSMSGLLVNEVLAQTLIVDFTGTQYFEITEALHTMTVCYLVAQITSVIAICTSGIATAVHIKKTITRKNGAALGWSISALIAAIVVLIFSAVGYNQIIEFSIVGKIIDSEAVLQTSYTPQIVAIVFLTLNVASAVLLKVLQKNNQENI